MKCLPRIKIAKKKKLMRTGMDRAMGLTRTIKIVTEAAKIKNKMYLQVKINKLLINQEVIPTVPVKVRPPKLLRATVTKTVQGALVAKPKQPAAKAKSTKEATPILKDSSIMEISNLRRRRELLMEALLKLKK